MRPGRKIEKVYLYSKPVDFRTSTHGLATLVELDINVAVSDLASELQVANRNSDK